jgi:hypothetical protein
MTQYLPYQSRSEELRRSGRRILYYFPKGLDPNKVEGLYCLVAERPGVFVQCSTVFYIEEVPLGSPPGLIKGSIHNLGKSWDFVCDRARKAYKEKRKTGRGPNMVFSQVPSAATNYECVLHILDRAHDYEEDDNDLDYPPYDYDSLPEYYVYEKSDKCFKHLNEDYTIVTETKGAKTKKKSTKAIKTTE